MAAVLTLPILQFSHSPTARQPGFAMVPEAQLEFWISPCDVRAWCPWIARSKRVQVREQIGPFFPRVEYAEWQRSQCSSKMWRPAACCGLRPSCASVLRSSTSQATSRREVAARAQRQRFVLRIFDCRLADRKRDFTVIINWDQSECYR